MVDVCAYCQYSLMLSTRTSCLQMPPTKWAVTTPVNHAPVCTRTWHISVNLTHSEVKYTAGSVETPVPTVSLMRKPFQPFNAISSLNLWRVQVSNNVWFLRWSYRAFLYLASVFILSKSFPLTENTGTHYPLLLFDLAIKCSCFPNSCVKPLMV